MCSLKRSLYNFKKSPKQWYKRFDNFAVSIDFIRSGFDHYLYFKKKNEML